MTPSPQSRLVVTVPLPPPWARGDPLTPVTTGRDWPSPAAAGEGSKEDHPAYAGEGLKASPRNREG